MLKFLLIVAAFIILRRIYYFIKYLLKAVNYEETAENANNRFVELVAKYDYAFDTGRFEQFDYRDIPFRHKHLVGIAEFHKKNADEIERQYREITDATADYHRELQKEQAATERFVKLSLGILKNNAKS